MQPEAGALRRCPRNEASTGSTFALAADDDERNTDRDEHARGDQAAGDVARAIARTDHVGLPLAGAERGDERDVERDDGEPRNHDAAHHHAGGVTFTSWKGSRRYFNGRGWGGLRRD